MADKNDIGNCEHDKGLHLFPDYDATGLWCADCGVGDIGFGYGTPDIDFPEIPAALLTTIHVWILAWELAREHGSINKENVRRYINESGEYLAGLVAQYYPCVFIAEKANIE